MTLPALERDPVSLLHVDGGVPGEVLLAKGRRREEEQTCKK